MFLESKLITLSPQYYTMYYYNYYLSFFTFVTVTDKIIYNDSIY